MEQSVGQQQKTLETSSTPLNENENAPPDTWLIPAWPYHKWYYQTATWCGANHSKNDITPESVVKIAYYQKVQGRWSLEWPKQRWQDTMNFDMKAHNLRPEMANDRAGWCSVIQKADPATAGKH